MRQNDHREFCNLVNSYLHSLGEEFDAIEDGGCFISSGANLVQLLHHHEKKEVVLAMAIFLNPGDDGYLIPEIIADFNAVHLYKGGYCMLVDQETKCLYVSQARPIGTLTPDTLGAIVEDFATRCRAWTLWYLKVSEEHWPDPLAA